MTDYVTKLEQFAKRETARADKAETDAAALRVATRELIGACLNVLPTRRNPAPDDSKQRLINLVGGLLRDGMPELEEDHPGEKLLADVAALRKALKDIENIADAGIDGVVPDHFFETGLPACFRIAHEALADLEEDHPGEKLLAVVEAAKEAHAKIMVVSPAAVEPLERLGKALADLEDKT